MSELLDIVNIPLSSHPDSPGKSIKQMLEEGLGLPIVLAAAYRGAQTAASLYEELDPVPSLEELHERYNGDVLAIIETLACRAEPASVQRLRRSIRRQEWGGF